MRLLPIDSLVRIVRRAGRACRTGALCWLLSSLPSLPALGADLQVALPEPEWLLSPVRQPLTAREPQILPNEQNLTEKVRPLVDLGNWQEAIDAIEETLTMDDDNPYQKASASMNQLLGQLYLQAGEAKKAEAALKEALLQLPTFVRAHQALGFLYLQAERYDEAREHIVRAASLGGDTPELFGYLGYLNQETGNYWGAISAYQRALMYGEGDFTLRRYYRQWRQGLLYNLIEARQYDSARAFVDDLLKEDPENESLWLYRAHAAMGAGDFETALASLEVAIRMGESTPTNLQLAAQLHLQLGSIDRAIALQESSLAADFNFDYLNQALTWLLREEQWGPARQLLQSGRQQWEALTPEQKSRLLDAEAQITTSTDPAQAATLLEQALSLDPGNPEALLHLAALYAKDKRYVQAELLYQRASVYDEARERALLGAAQLAIDQFDYPKALATLRDLLARNPDHPDLRQNVRILENLVNTSQNTEPLLIQ